MPEGPRQRVLCFHGFRSSGKALEAGLFQTSFLAHLRDVVDFVWLDAPYKCDEEEISTIDEKDLVGEEYCEWFRVHKESKEAPLEYQRFGESVNYVAAYMKEQQEKGLRPFDGVLGYGQGATFCHAFMLLQRQGEVEELEDLPELKYCILISGSKCNAADLLKVYKGAPFKIPAMCFWNVEDPLIKPKDSEDLANVFRDSLCIPKGLRVHELPKLTREEVAESRAWLAKVEREANAPTMGLSMWIFVGAMFAFAFFFRAWAASNGWKGDRSFGQLVSFSGLVP